MTDKMRKKNPENHIVGFLMKLFANYGGKYVFGVAVFHGLGYAP